MKKILILVLCLCFSFGLVGCKTSKVSTPKPTATAIGACTVTTYKKYAQPLMQDFHDIIEQLDIRDASSRKSIKLVLETLLTRIGQVRCRDAFPLKQETLVYSVKHMIDAINYIDDGNLEEANFSINKSLLNIEAFQDWSVDVD